MTQEDAMSLIAFRLLGKKAFRWPGGRRRGVRPTVEVLDERLVPSFAATGPFPVNSAPVAVTAADFNGDGRLDFAAVNASSGNVSIRLGNGQGGFAVAPDVAVGSVPTNVAVGDFDG